MAKFSSFERDSLARKSKNIYSAFPAPDFMVEPRPARHWCAYRGESHTQCQGGEVGPRSINCFPESCSQTLCPRPPGLPASSRPCGGGESDQRTERERGGNGGRPQWNRSSARRRRKFPSEFLFLRAPLAATVTMTMGRPLIWEGEIGAEKGGRIPHAQRVRGSMFQPSDWNCRAHFWVF